MYDKTYVKTLRGERDTWKVFAILLLVATLFLAAVFYIQEKKVGRLQKRIEVLESTDTEILVPDGKGNVREFKIIKRF